MTFKFEKNCHKLFLKSKSKNYLVSIAIGQKHYFDWKRFSSKLWLKYCKRNNLGLIIIYKDLISKESLNWKSPTWQRLLVSQYLRLNLKNVGNICLLDTDIFINPLAPNIFSKHKRNKISAVKAYKDIPFLKSNFNLRKKLVFLRKNFLSKNYPLNSSLTASPQEIFKYYKFKKIFNNYFVAGLLVFNVKKFQKILSNIYRKYCSKTLNKKFTGVEVPLNNELMSLNLINWIDYKFQAIWLFEIADKYNFLYYNKFKDKKILKIVIEQILIENYFLHFAGTLSDANNVWKIDKILNDNKKLELIKKYQNFEKKKIKTKFHKIKIKNI